MSPTTDTQPTIETVNADQAREWLKRADDHYARAARLNLTPQTTRKVEPDTQRRAELELALAHYAKERAEDLADEANRPAGTDLTF